MRSVEGGRIILTWSGAEVGESGQSVKLLRKLSGFESHTGYMIYNHREAYCLMKYRSDDGTEEEIIWNSRDGVTPFTLTLRSGKIATHVDWQLDRRVPDYVPKSGERIFIDLTKERAMELAARHLENWRASGMDMDMDGAPTVDELAESYMRPGAPDIKVVE